jgi:hypothetical protein
MWSPQQHSILNAMGYTLYARPSNTAQKHHSVESNIDLHHVTASSDSTLFQALMKATKGRDVSDLNINIEALRSSAHAKRALWPQLRAMLKH